jgi:hypothetical protein
MDQDGISWKTDAEFRSVISPLFKLSLRTGYTYGEYTINRIGKNRLSGLLDSNYTQNSSMYSNTFTVYPMLTYYGNRVEISAGGSVYHSSRNWVERFPDWEQEKDRFLYFNPVLELKATFSPTSNLDASYYTESQKPSVDHLRSVIDDANPLNLRSGNPNLKVTHEHQLNVNYYKILPLLSASLQSGISLMIKRNPIVSNSRYFTETTYLPEYNYTVERGATLHTYENSDPEYFLRVVVGFEKFWSFLGKCTFAPSYERRVTPSFTQGEENDLTMNRGVFDVNILTNFSKKVSLTIFSKSAFDHSTSQLGQSSKSLEETLTLRSSTKIIPKCSVDVNMVYNYRKNLTFQNEENNILLNVFISRSLGKYFSMSLNGYNLLDSKNKNTIGTTAEYDFRRGHNQTGRYITMNLTCKF